MSVLKKHFYRVFVAGVGPYAGGKIIAEECITQEPMQACEAGIVLMREYWTRREFWTVQTEKLVTRAALQEVRDNG